MTNAPKGSATRQQCASGLVLLWHSAMRLFRNSEGIRALCQIARAQTFKMHLSTRGRALAVGVAMVTLGTAHSAPRSVSRDVSRASVFRQITARATWLLTSPMGRIGAQVWVILGSKLFLNRPGKDRTARFVCRVCTAATVTLRATRNRWRQGLPSATARVDTPVMVFPIATLFATRHACMVIAPPQTRAPVTTAGRASTALSAFRVHTHAMRTRPARVVTVGFGATATVAGSAMASAANQSAMWSTVCMVVV